MLGSFHQVDPLRRLLGILLVGIVLGVWVQLLALMQRLKAREHESRWASNIRDAINLACMAGLVGAFWADGLPLPAALLVGGTLGVALDTIRYATSDRSRVRSWALGVTCAAGLGAAVMAPQLLTACNRIAVFALGRS